MKVQQRSQPGSAGSRERRDTPWSLRGDSARRHLHFLLPGSRALRKPLLPSRPPTWPHAGRAALGCGCQATGWTVKEAGRGLPAAAPRPAPAAAAQPDGVARLPWAQAELTRRFSPSLPVALKGTAPGSAPDLRPTAPARGQLALPRPVAPPNRALSSHTQRGRPLPQGAWAPGHSRPSHGKPVGLGSPSPSQRRESVALPRRPSQPECRIAHARHTLPLGVSS